MDNIRFKAAAAHVAPVYLDAAATADKAAYIIAEAARNGASLVAFPESFIPGFPVWSALYAPIYSNDHFRKFAATSIFADDAEIDRIRQAARQHGVFVSIGFSEKNKASVGGLWNSNLLISDTGKVLVHHRKLVPTFYEKLVWNPGDGAGLQVVETRIGRLGGLICGENTNPLARYTLMTQGEQVHISSYPPVWPTRPTSGSDNYDNRAANRIRAAAHSFEGKCFGIVVAGCLDVTARKAIARDDRSIEQVLEECPRASSFFVGPTGALIGEEIVEEGVGYTEIDLAACVEPKRFHDVVAGYNRFDIFDLAVTRTRVAPITFGTRSFREPLLPEVDAPLSEAE